MAMAAAGAYVAFPNETALLLSVSGPLSATPRGGGSVVERETPPSSSPSAPAEIYIEGVRNWSSTDAAPAASETEVDRVMPDAERRSHGRQGSAGGSGGSVRVHQSQLVASSTPPPPFVQGSLPSYQDCSPPPSPHHQQTTYSVSSSSNNNNSSSSSSWKKTQSYRPFDLLRRLTGGNSKSRRHKESAAASSPLSGTGPSARDDSRPYLDDDFVQERILDIDLTPLVALPSGVEMNEWLASHTLSFFEHLNLIYGCVSEQCNQSSACASMVGPGNVQHQWVDERGKRLKCTAPQYVDYVMSFSHKMIYDETVFPTKYGNQFPSSFEAIVKKIHRLLLHVLGHVYQCHWQHLVAAPAVAGNRLHGYVNTLAYHFLLFNKHFSLIEDKEIEVLDDLFDRLQFYASSSQRQARKTLMYDSSSSTSNEQFATDVSPSADENKENMVTGRCLGTDSIPATSAAVLT